MSEAHAGGRTSRAPDPPADSYVAHHFGRRDWRTLHDILVFTDRAVRLIERGHDAYDQDEMLQFAAEKICIDVGEAATRLSDEIVAAHTEIAFRAMRRQRNLAAHRYEVIVPHRIWMTLEDHLPVDVAKIRELIARVASP